ncbi:hypothetical protein CRG98_023626 [Punica granatum]|uniref:DYW domain-containing protein n=1 Tax=Punica granatum TaxID=22663 RepID=A0A2I0JIA9_PUNGR|nr:hypothetical protein CRG98_023626 [Punica granatum]
MALVVSTRPPPPHTLPGPGKPDGAAWDSHGHLLRLLTECSDMSQLKQIHAHALRTAPLDCPRGLFLQSRILHFSAADLEYALRVFGQIENPNTFMWNTLIRAFAVSNDRKEEAISIFETMLSDGSVSPDKHTFPFVLKACAYLFAIAEGQQIHAQLLKRGLGSDVYANNSLIHFYSSCGDLDVAWKMFDKMRHRTVVSWNVMIDALVRSAEFYASLELFREMQRFFRPDGYTIQSVLGACAGLGSLSLGLWAHAYVLRNSDVIEINDPLVNASLVDMYCKCGSLELAVQVFRGMLKRDVNSWNSMILGFAMHGQAYMALRYFSDMITEHNLIPNSVTFVGVLGACNHRGMVDEGRKFFDMMVHEYRVDPQLEHYGCLVDLLARAGLINEALDLVSSMPLKPDAVIWRSLLDACCKKNVGVELSEVLAMKILESGGGDSCSGVYVLLSRVYASARKWDDVGMVRKLMADRGVSKNPGCSLIEIDGVLHKFFAGDTTHPFTKEIYDFLSVIEEKLGSMGYIPDVSQAPMVVDDARREKEQSLMLHSERLAIAFGLLNRKNGTPIRVFKNLRVCNDCHSITKLVSRIFDVEIVVRDRARFHHFKDGFCSCGDYW